jgi:hypothetical protein
VRNQRETNRNIMLHLWGFLGDVTWALSRNSAVVHCYAPLATQQFKRRACPQHCYARDSRHRDVSMVTGLLSTDFYWFVVSPCLEIAECRRACVWLRTPFGWKTKLVLGNYERSTCLEASWVQEWEFVLEGKNAEAARAPVSGDLLTARMWVRVGRLPEEVL